MNIFEQRELEKRIKSAEEYYAEDMRIREQLQKILRLTAKR